MAIKIITEPTVHLVGRQEIDEHALDEFLGEHDVSGWTTDTDVAAEKLCEVAGRLCYMSFSKPRPGGNSAYLAHILEVGHGSVLEHAVFNFIITGVSRSFTHELVRHRVGFSYSQLSQRYVDESDVAFVVPPLIRDEVSSAAEFFARNKDEFSFEDYTEVYDRSWADDGTTTEGKAMLVGLKWLSGRERNIDEYTHGADYLALKLINRHFPQDGVKTIGDAKAWLVRNKDQATRFRKMSREASRSVLPNCTETKIFVTGNVRSLRHFIEMRGDASADAEIQRVARAMLKVLKAESPHLFGDYDDSGESVTTPYRKI